MTKKILYLLMLSCALVVGCGDKDNKNSASGSGGAGSGGAGGGGAGGGNATNGVVKNLIVVGS